MKQIIITDDRNHYKLINENELDKFKAEGWVKLVEVVAVHSGNIVICKGITYVFEILNKETGEVAPNVGVVAMFTPDKPTPNPKAMAFFKESANYVAQLASRWLDESQYENINDYKTPALVEMAAKHGVTITEMTKRPFGFKFEVDGIKFVAKMYADGKYTYSRLA